MGHPAGMDATFRTSFHSVRKVGVMVIRPKAFNPYEFVVVASLRAQQLLAGSVPRVEGDHNATTLAQMEVMEGRVSRTAAADAQGPHQTFWQL